MTRNIVVEAGSKSPSTTAKTLNSYYRNLPGQWIGRAGGLIDRGKEASATFKQHGETIVGQILIGNCFPSTSLVTRINGDSIIISGKKNERSFRAVITSEFGEVTGTSLYTPYKIVSDVSGCVKKESGFLKMEKQ